MIPITYKIELLEPLLIEEAGGDENTTISADYIAGSVIRGALIGRYGKICLADEKTRRLFFSDQTLFLNAYLENCVPTPRSWFFEKGKEERIYDFAVEDGELEKPEKASVRYVSPGNYFDAPQREVRIQTARNREYGRARGTEAKEGEFPGNVYQYEPLSAGQTFVGQLLCREEDVETLKSCLVGEFHLGSGRTAGYGRVNITLDDKKSYGVSPNNNDDRGDLADGVTIVTLLSDVLVRDQYGVFSADPSVLARSLLPKRETQGIETQSIETQGIASLQGAFIETTLIGGFNRKWGLFLPQQRAVAMGSVLIFENLSAEQLEHLKHLEKVGVGERRNEGFGRIAINWQTSAKFNISRDDRSKEIKFESFTDEIAKNLAKEMVKRRQETLWEREMLSQLHRENNFQLARKVKKSQLYRLRLELQNRINGLSKQETPQEIRQQLVKYLTNLGERNSTKRQWSEEALEWCRGIVDQKMEKVPLDQKKVVMGGVSASSDECTILIHNLRYLDAWLERAAKLKRQEGDDGNQ